MVISTHTSRVGCDAILSDWPPVSFLFLLTHPVWDVTLITIFFSSPAVISTHTSRVGCDDDSFCIAWHFRISTHTSRVGCDICHYIIEVNKSISTHTSRVGCDAILSGLNRNFIYFYSHIPCGM